MLEPLIIKRRGEDYYRIVSIRLEEDLLQSIEAAAENVCRSRNSLINLLLRYGMEHIKIENP